MAQDVRRSSERAKRLPRAVREKQILDAAVKVFSQHGYHMASMDVISEVAGVSKPMIYSYLGAKEELFGHCVRRESNRLLEAVRNGIRLDVPPDMQLWHGLRSFYGFVAEYRESWIVLHRHALTSGDPFAEEVTALRTRAVELVTPYQVPAVLWTVWSIQEQGDKCEPNQCHGGSVVIGVRSSLFCLGEADSRRSAAFFQPKQKREDLTPGQISVMAVPSWLVGTGRADSGTDIRRPRGGR